MSVVTCLLNSFSINMHVFDNKIIVIKLINYVLIKLTHQSGDNCHTSLCRIVATN